MTPMTAFPRTRQQALARELRTGHWPRWLWRWEFDELDSEERLMWFVNCHPGGRA